MADYYRDHPDAVPDEIPGQGVEVVEKEPTVVPKAKKPKATTKKATTKVEEETKVEEPVAQDDWVEDDDGNFVKKGD